MKNILIKLLIVVPISFFINVRCDNPKTPIVTDSSKDTLFITTIRHDSTYYPYRLYRIISQNVENGFDTSYTDTTPPTASLLKFDHKCTIFTLRTTERFILLKNDTIRRFVDNQKIQDTIFVLDTLWRSSTTYRDTINCRIDTIEAYRSRHKPYFENKDSIAEILNKPFEGYKQYIQLPAYHFDNDSAVIKLIGNPPWVQLKATSIYDSYGDCWFYNCKNEIFDCETYAHGDPFSGVTTRWDCRKWYIGIKADSTALDSSFQWKVIISNKYSLADTINVYSRVTPFPYSTRCP